MPIKDTPWGTMKQTGAAMNAAGDGTKIPPKPGFLPPAPPPFSISPIPPSNGPADHGGSSSVVYDKVIEQTVQPNKDNLITNGASNSNTTRSDNSCEETNFINTDSNIQNDSHVTSSISNGSSKGHNSESFNFSITSHSPNEKDNNGNSKSETEEESESSYEYYDTSSEDEEEGDGEVRDCDAPEKELEKALDSQDGKQSKVSLTDDYLEEDDEWEYEDEYEDEADQAEVKVENVNIDVEKEKVRLIKEQENKDKAEKEEKERLQKSEIEKKFTEKRQFF